MNFKVFYISKVNDKLTLLLTDLIVAGLVNPVEKNCNCESLPKNNMEGVVFSSDINSVLIKKDNLSFTL